LVVKGKGTNMRVIIVLVIAFALAACDQARDPQSPAPVIAASTAKPQVPSLTAEDWRAAVAGTYVESMKRDEGDGVYTAVACFEKKADGKCAKGATIRRDGFRKLTFFESSGSGLSDIAHGLWRNTMLTSYVSLPDCALPVHFMRVDYIGESWLFMNKVAVMVDGVVVLERDLPAQKVDRNVGRTSLTSERLDFVATHDEEVAIQKVLQGKEVMVRITGEKGYVSLKAKDIDSLKKDVEQTRDIQERLTKAVEGKLPARCS
jgi:hypothetical protein